MTYLTLRYILPYFEDIRSVVSNRTGFIGLHIPLHPESLSRWGFNIHGHLHANRYKSILQ